MTTKKIKITENIKVKKKHLDVLKKEKQALNKLNQALKQDIQKLEEKEKLTLKQNQDLVSLNKKLVKNSKSIVKNTEATTKSSQAIEQEEAMQIKLANSASKATTNLKKFNDEIINTSNKAPKTAPKKPKNNNNDSSFSGFNIAGLLAVLSSAVPPQFKLPLLGLAGLVGAGAGAASLAGDYSNTTKEAKRYGMTTAEFYQLEKIGSRLNFSAEDLGDLVEELRNKKGEKENKAYIDGLRMAKINPAEFHNKTPYQQLEILLTKLSKVKDLDIRASIADSLLGNSANKIVTGLENENISKLFELQQTDNQKSKDDNLVNASNVVNDFLIDFKKIAGELTAKTISDQNKEDQIQKTLKEISNQIGNMKNETSSNKQSDPVVKTESQNKKVLEEILKTNQQTNNFIQQIMLNKQINKNNNNGAYQ